MTLKRRQQQKDIPKHQSDITTKIFNELEIRNSQIHIDGVELIEHIQQALEQELPQLRDRGLSFCRDSSVRVDRICQASRYLDPSETCLFAFLECCMCGDTSSCRTGTFFMRITRKERDCDWDEHAEWSWRIPLSRFEADGEFEHRVRFSWNYYWDVLGLNRPST